MQTWSDKYFMTCKDNKMDNDFGLAVKERGWAWYYPGIIDILTGRLYFSAVLVLYSHGYTLLIKFNLITCFVFDLLEYCVHDALSVLLPQGKTDFLI